jgi:hypothetical protein
MATNECNDLLKTIYNEQITEQLRSSSWIIDLINWEQAILQALLACTLGKREDPLLKHYYFYHPDDEPETITFEVI